ncbi:hypothetical protein Tco_0864519 [Tanacetum coccineum]
MADHSHDWYDETTTRERINDVMDNVDAIHESFKGKHLTKETFEGTNGNGNPKEIHNAKAQDNEGDMDPLTPQTVYITPSGNDYVAPATNPMSNKQLNKFEKEFSNITKGDEKEYDNPVIETYGYESFFRKLLHQVSQSSREMKSQQQIQQLEVDKELARRRKESKDFC